MTSSFASAADMMARALGAGGYRYVVIEHPISSAPAELLGEHPRPLALSLFTFFWVSGFDIIYSTLDEEFDRRAGLQSLPAWLGRRRALAVSLAFHLAAFACLGALYWWELRSLVAGMLLLVVGALLYLEHRKADDVELAFFKINAALGFVILAFVYAGVSRL